MAVLPILRVPEVRLRLKAKRVRTVDGSIQKLIDDMLETMRQANGMGLAAPQVGVPLRVIVIEIPEAEPIVLINPQIVKRSEEQSVTEGCLCLPGYRGEISRSARAVAKGWNRQGKEVRIKAEGLLAQVLQHELDHLNGTLYIDHLESPDKLQKLEPAEEAEPKSEEAPARG